jgi:hypothetical protein
VWKLCCAFPSFPLVKCYTPLRLLDLFSFVHGPSRFTFLGFCLSIWIWCSIPSSFHKLVCPSLLLIVSKIINDVHNNIITNSHCFQSHG